MFFPKDILYVKLYLDKIEIRNIRTLKSITSYPQLKYSNDRLLVANFDHACTELKKSIAQVTTYNKLTKIATVVFQPMHTSITDFSQVELMSFRDLCNTCGVCKVFLYLEKDTLTDASILQNLTSKNSVFTI